MIPRRIKVVNFLSYSECELDLSGLRLAVLSGRNGDGKSALLDAMTWAVWGKGRGRTDDDRIRLNANHALVEFEFESQGATYRIIRKRTRGKSAGQLDFYQMQGAEWRAVTGGTMAQTQAEIVRRLRMDFETFENSAFIAQGRANEFTRRTAKERKDVFRKILGLELYEQLAVAANDRRKEAEGACRNTLALIAQAEEELAEIPAIEEAIEASKQAIGCMDRELAALDSTVAELRALAAVHDRLISRLAEDEQRFADNAAATERDERALADLEREIVAVCERLKSADMLEHQHAELVDLRAEEASLGEAMTAATGLDRAMRAARSEIGEEQARLETRRVSLTEEVAKRQEAAGGVDALRQASAAFEAEEREIAGLRDDARAATAAATAHREAKAAAEANAAQCKAQNTELHRKREQLLEAKKAGGSIACPICRQPLAPGDFQHIIDEYGAQKKELGRRHDDAMDAAKQAAAAAKAEEARATELESAARGREQQLRRERQTVVAALALAEESERLLPALSEELSAIARDLESQSFAPAARSRLAGLQAEFAALRYDEQRHTEVRAKIAELADVEAGLRELAAARTRSTHLVEQKAEVEGRLVNLKDEREKLGECVRTARAELDAAEDVAPRLGEADSELAAARQRHVQLTLSLGSQMERLQHLRQVAAKVEEAKAQAAASIEETGLFKDLAQAFSRDGVQAMLMEQSLPRLEHITNAMLDRMTSGRINVQLRTQRTGKGGNVQETLDILISDELGTRDYEMYSGGEAFRVDFALRIALARLLAERAGAELPMLIIDEGFGSQDAEGIDRLVDAITSVSEEFRLILVVTHVDEMRGRFEQRIEVTKDPERGSFARVA